MVAWPTVYLAPTPSLESFRDCSVRSVLVACGVLAVLELTELCLLVLAYVDLRWICVFRMFGVSLTATSVRWSVSYYTLFNSWELVTLSPWV